MNKSKKKESMTVNIKIVLRHLSEKKNIYNVSTKIQFLCSIINTDSPLLFSRD